MGTRSVKPAWMLILLSVVGMVIGGAVGAAIAGLLTAGQDGLSQLAAAFGAISIGIPVGVAVLGVVWSLIYRRKWWVVLLALLGIFSLATFLALLSLADTVMGQVLLVLIVVAALICVFLVGIYAPASSAKVGKTAP